MWAMKEFLNVSKRRPCYIISSIAALTIAANFSTTLLCNLEVRMKAQNEHNWKEVRERKIEPLGNAFSRLDNGRRGARPSRAPPSADVLFSAEERSGEIERDARPPEALGS
ncbi:hypothetical protein EVAR_69362_1 [Eumeta japonica]|uniref:Uncharacterized protein n=1 Tax=Eumeta variegata TaxID=151549 RepID=A0A4C1SDP2_EUMVA|nr:hypothetical protein EVAR_69362_1 [Eumeta japonica]